MIKKLTKQCASCPSASIMILQKGVAISSEGRHLVLTLFASMYTANSKFSRKQIISLRFSK